MGIEMSELAPLKLNPPLNPTLVTDGAGLLRMTNHLLKSKRVLGWDKETTPAKDFYVRRDRLWQIGDRNEQFVVDLLAFVDGNSTVLGATQGNYGKNLDPRLRAVVDAFTPFLCTGDYLKVGVNLGFEYEQSYWCFGMRTWKLFSCDVVERLLVAGEHSLKDYGYFSMEEMAARYFNAQINKDLQMSFNLTDPITSEQVEYAAIDVVLPLAFRQLQYPLLKDTSMIEIAGIENNAIGSFIDMHIHGMRVDTDKWNGIGDRNIADFKKLLTEELDPVLVPLVGSKSAVITDVQIAEAQEKWKSIDLKDQVRRPLRDKLKKEASDLGKRRTKQRNLVAKCEGDALINYSSGAQMLEVFETMPGLKGLTSTDDSDLSEYKHVPVIAAFLKYRKLSKSIKTYGKTWTSTWTTSPGFKHKKTKEAEGWQEGWLHPYDYRLHPKFNQLDAETGRSTSSQPNGQNIPKAEEIRACFVADPPDADEPEGYCIVTADMSGAELRILAELSGEKVWIDAFNHGDDVHEVCAEMMYPAEWPGWASPECVYYKIGADGLPQHKKCKCQNHGHKRDDAKVPNFLIPYGGQASNLAAQTGKSVEEAQDILDKHKDSFPDLWNYLDASAQAARDNRAAWDMFGRRRLFPEPTWDRAIQEIIESAKEEEGSRWEKWMRKDPKFFGIMRPKWTEALWEQTVETETEAYTAANGKKPSDEALYDMLHRQMPQAWTVSSMMKSMFGRIERQGKNHPIQGTNASIIKLAMGCGYSSKGMPFLWHTLPRLKAKILAMVHDELLVQCPVRYSKLVANMTGRAFAVAAAEKMSKVKMTFDFHIDSCWRK